MAVLAEHSSEEPGVIFPGTERWGSATRATHCSEGEAGHNVSL
jgi:hypothetical protein